MKDTISFIPRYDETAEQAAEHLRLALPLLSRHSLPVNPINYAIGYDYVAGHNRLLREAIDRLHRERRPLTQALCIRFYKQYILDEAARRFERVGDSLHSLVQTTCSELEKTEQQTSRAVDTLAQQATALERQPAENIHAILKAIVESSHLLASAGNELKTSLQTTNQEILQLRSELETMKEVAFTDALTGLLNRRAFDLRIQQLLQEQSTTDTPFLLLLDLDHFKKINDRFGHLSGDKVLRCVAQIIRQHVPRDQTAARFGGEEMAVLLTRCTHAEAFQVAERIRTTLARSRLQRRDSREFLGQVTLSVGLAGLRPGDTAETWIERTDRALYAAKQQGRNRVVSDHHASLSASA